MTKQQPALAALLLLASSTASAEALASPCPRIATGTVNDSEEGTPSLRAPWRAWSLARPADVVVGTGSDSRVGDIRPAAFYADFGARAAEGGEWVVAIETQSADGAGAFALTRSTLNGQFTSFPPATLARMPDPRASASGPRAIVTWDALALDGHAFGEAEGLAAYAVLRLGQDGSSTEIGRVPAGPGPFRFVDAAAPPGSTRYALAPVFAGGVLGTTSSLPSAAVTLREVVAGPGGLLGSTPRPRPADRVRRSR